MLLLLRRQQLLLLRLQQAAGEQRQLWCSQLQATRLPTIFPLPALPLRQQHHLVVLLLLLLEYQLTPADLPATPHACPQLRTQATHQRRQLLLKRQSNPLTTAQHQATPRLSPLLLLAHTARQDLLLLGYWVAAAGLPATHLLALLLPVFPMHQCQHPALLAAAVPTQGCPHTRPHTPIVQLCRPLLLLLQLRQRYLPVAAEDGRPLLLLQATGTLIPSARSRTAQQRQPRPNLLRLSSLEHLLLPLLECCQQHQARKFLPPPLPLQPSAVLMTLLQHKYLARLQGHLLTLQHLWQQTQAQQRHQTQAQRLLTLQLPLLLLLLLHPVLLLPLQLQKRMAQPQAHVLTLQEHQQQQQQTKQQHETQAQQQQHTRQQLLLGLQPPLLLLHAALLLSL
jgi:hypothetical protein